MSFIQYLHQFMQMRGPFLIVVPLSTIAHWQREFELTTLNCVVLDNSQTSRAVMREHEFHSFEVAGKPQSVKTAFRFDVLLTSYSTLLAESLLLGKIKFQAMVLDEAQRSKGTTSKITTILQGSLKYEHAVLLTGTPIQVRFHCVGLCQRGPSVRCVSEIACNPRAQLIVISFVCVLVRCHFYFVQNNLSELWSLLHTIAPHEFRRLDVFLEEFGQLQEMNQIAELHRRLRPYLLRRMKEDVEVTTQNQTRMTVTRLHDSRIFLLRLIDECAPLCQFSSLCVSFFFRKISLLALRLLWSAR